MDKIVGMAFAIHKALETVRENKEECRAIEQRVRQISDLLWLLNRQEMVKNRVIYGMLEDMHDAVARALEVVTSCQGSNFLRLSCVGKLANKQMRQVQDDLGQKLLLLVFASSVCLRRDEQSQSCVIHSTFSSTCTSFSSSGCCC
ncbi:hypothetical protein QOZ80_9AG0692000 [Eleusine coracana subsp. coracana]|nr:hypothetical protein QOZ80_9AG0692000 [Eleusine coracana subsp. coracana]